ncbi:hypothetical protein AAFF_G00141960 [Aldrovandia affinis]|uniref:Uncharacterized protein n=1 Tax=Aldrovandia affinis TaxID=143900 RepID=A0AAD7TCL3_9TELE|nr:hypothetical protein AAFF_G00141960 [Aldrovandia affinis]
MKQQADQCRSLRDAEGPVTGRCFLPVSSRLPLQRHAVTIARQPAAGCLATAVTPCTSGGGKFTPVNESHMPLSDDITESDIIGQAGRSSLGRHHNIIQR